MTDAPASALAAAESAIIEAATDFGHDDIVCGSSRQFARATLEAASPLLAEAWGVRTPQAKPYRSVVRSVPCPSCGASASEMCRTLTATATRYHAARKRALAAENMSSSSAATGEDGEP